MLWASLLLLRLAHQLGNPLIKGSAGRLVGVRDSFLCVFFLFFCFHLSLSLYSYCTNPSSSLCLSHHHPARRVAASFFNPHLWPLYCYYILHSPGVLQWEVLAWKLSPLALSPLNPSNPNKEKKEEKNTREVRNDRHIDVWRTLHTFRLEKNQEIDVKWEEESLGSNIRECVEPLLTVSRYFHSFEFCATFFCCFLYFSCVAMWARQKLRLWLQGRVWRACGPASTASLSLFLPWRNKCVQGSPHPPAPFTGLLLPQSVRWWVLLIERWREKRRVGALNIIMLIIVFL